MLAGLLWLFWGAGFIYESSVLLGSGGCGIDKAEGTRRFEIDGLWLLSIASHAGRLNLENRIISLTSVDSLFRLGFSHFCGVDFLNNRWLLRIFQTSVVLTAEIQCP